MLNVTAPLAHDSSRCSDPMIALSCFQTTRRLSQLLCASPLPLPACYNAQKLRYEENLSNMMHAHLVQLVGCRLLDAQAEAVARAEDKQRAVVHPDGHDAPRRLSQAVHAVQRLQHHEVLLLEALLGAKQLHQETTQHFITSSLYHFEFSELVAFVRRFMLCRACSTT